MPTPLGTRAALAASQRPFDVDRSVPAWTCAPRGRDTNGKEDIMLTLSIRYTLDATQAGRLRGLRARRGRAHRAVRRQGRRVLRADAVRRTPPTSGAGSHRLPEPRRLRAISGGCRRRPEHTRGGEAGRPVGLHPSSRPRRSSSACRSHRPRSWLTSPRRWGTIGPPRQGRSP